MNIEENQIVFSKQELKYLQQLVNSPGYDVLKEFAEKSLSIMKDKNINGVASNSNEQILKGTIFVSGASNALLSMFNDIESVVHSIGK